MAQTFNKLTTPVCACLLIGALLFITGCNRVGGSAEGKSGSENDKKKQAIPVEVMTLKQGEIESTIRASTNLEAEEEVKVFSRASNRVIELLVEEGDPVEKDQLLLRLESDLQRTQVAKAEGRVSKARAEFQRQKSLFDQNLISEQAFSETQHDLKQLELAAEDAKRDLEYTEVRAPISGTLAQRSVKLGDLVTMNQQLFNVVNFRSIVARVHRPEKELRTLKLGQTARVTAPSVGENVFEGIVERISPVVESKTGTVKVTVGFKEIGALRPGMYVDVEIVLAKRKDAVLLPKRALMYDHDQRYVYRLLTGRKVERVIVEPKLEDKLNVEPSDLLKEGDEIVVAGQTGLKDGALVRLPSDPKPVEDKDGKGTKKGSG